MKRVTIKNKQGITTHQGELEDPTDWIAENVAINAWGLPIRWVNSDQCSDQDKAEALATNIITSPGMPDITVYQLPATYTIEITDIQSEIDAENQRRANIVLLKQRLKAIAAQADMTAADIKEAIFKLLKMKVLMKDLD